MLRFQYIFFCCTIIHYDMRNQLIVKISIKPWYGLVRASLNFVGALSI